MKLATMSAALAAGLIAAASSVALAGPPVPKPAAGALPQPPSTAVAKSYRSQTPEEQKAAAGEKAVPLTSARIPTQKQK